MLAHTQVEDAATKPLLRGISHQHAIFAALAAGILLVASARGLEAKLCCGLYVACLTMLFTASALYHRYHAPVAEIEHFCALECGADMRATAYFLLYTVVPPRLQRYLK